MKDNIVNSIKEDVKSLKELTVLDRIMHVVTLILALLTIVYGASAVVKVNNQLFSVVAALLIGAWLWFMYRKVL